MRIYGEGIDDRLASVVQFEPVIAGKSYLSVIHPNDTKRWISEELSERLKDVHCRGILLVKGVDRAGISEAWFQSLKDQYGSRFHISARAVGTTQEDSRLFGARAVRFARFFEIARTTSVLNWEIIDPPWPEALVAVYLLARVMWIDDHARSVIEGCRGGWESIWQDAKREYQSVAQKDLHSTLTNHNAEAVALEIGEYLATVQLTCDASRQRGRLRHMWLKNQVLPMDEDFVVLMRTNPTLREARESFEEKIKPNGEFARRVEETRQLLQDAVDGFDPSQLVESGPLSILRKDVRSHIRPVLRQQYLQKTSIEKSVEAATKVIENLELDLREFSIVWYQRPMPAEALMKKRFKVFHERARTLQECLGNIPEGIVLP